jgi:tRNA(His) 5'-end guanylyltransferase
MTDSLGDRMKANYEDRSRFYLTRRTPVIIRVDGRAFHTVTKSCKKPYDDWFAGIMDGVAEKLCQEIQGAKCAYVQSDEISILLIDYDKLTTDAWFDYNIQKMVSVSASTAAAWFNTWASQELGHVGTFDSRVFNIPREEVCNYFVWRQQDWIRNSLEMLARSHYSHKELNKKNAQDMHEMLHQKNVNWADLPDKWKNGRFLSKIESVEVVPAVFTDPPDDSNHGEFNSLVTNWKVWDACPIFQKNRSIIEYLLTPKET